MERMRSMKEPMAAAIIRTPAAETRGVAAEGFSPCAQ